MGDFMKGLGALGPAAAISAGSDILGTVMGMALSGWQDKRQLRQQQKLTDIQTNAQKGMIDYQNAATYDMWQKTGPQGQVAQLKEAGLNPALMYGMGGGTGGQSVTQSAGVGAGSTSQQPMAMMLSDLGTKAAQIKLAEAQARNLDANTAKTAGVDTQTGYANIAKLRAETATEEQKKLLTEAEAQLKQLENQWKSKVDFQTVTDGMEAMYKKMVTDYEQAIQQKRITTAEADKAKQMVSADLAVKGAQALFLQSGARLNDQKVQESLATIDKITQDIAESKARVENMGKVFDLSEAWQKHRLEIENISDAMKVGVQAVQGIISTAAGYFGGKGTTTTKTTNEGYNADGKGYYNETKTTTNRN